MLTVEASIMDHHEPELYEIRIKGHFENRGAARFGDLTITAQDLVSPRFSGPVVDQAARPRLLSKVRGVGMPFLSVTRVRPGQAEAKARHTRS